MRIVNFSIGKKIYSLLLNENEIDNVTKLASKLNMIVNKNTLKYRNLSIDNIIFLTTLELIFDLENLKEQVKDVSTIEKVKEDLSNTSNNNSNLNNVHKEEEHIVVTMENINNTNDVHSHEISCTIESTSKQSCNNIGNDFDEALCNKNLTAIADERVSRNDVINEDLCRSNHKVADENTMHEVSFTSKDIEQIIANRDRKILKKLVGIFSLTEKIKNDLHNEEE